MHRFSDPVFIGKSYIIHEGEPYEVHKDGPPTLVPYRDMTEEAIEEQRQRALGR